MNMDISMIKLCLIIRTIVLHPSGDNVKILYWWHAFQQHFQKNVIYPKKCYNIFTKNDVHGIIIGTSNLNFKFLK